jgi:VIT1/CCC1 family predicted Fe2+/Mn2+ transporter
VTFSRTNHGTICSDSYRQTHLEIKDQIVSDPATTYSQISQVFSEYDLPPALISQLTNHVSSSSSLPDFLMRFHHDTPIQTSSRAFTCALTIALGYFVGGFIPLLPYLFVGRQDVTTALCFSVGVMVLALFAFGYCRTAFVSGWTGIKCVWKNVMGGAQMVVVGGAAAGSAMGLVRAFNSFM